MAVANGLWLGAKGVWLCAKGLWLGANGLWLGAKGLRLGAKGLSRDVKGLLISSLSRGPPSMPGASQVVQRPISVDFPAKC